MNNSSKWGIITQACVTVTVIIGTVVLAIFHDIPTETASALLGGAVGFTAAHSGTVLGAAIGSTSGSAGGTTTNLP